MEKLINYQGKNCVVTGAASGVGKALVKKLMNEGANVYALDINPVEGVTEYLKVNLCKKEEIDAALTKIPNSVDALFSNAAVAGPSYIGYEFTVPECFAINFIACRYLIDKLKNRMPEGSAIAVTSSTTGENWKEKVEILDDLYDNSYTYEDGEKWAGAHLYDEQVFNGLERPDCLYTFSKEALIYYVKRESFDLLKKGIRINVLCPGGIETQMTDEIAKIVGSHEWDKAATNPIMDRATSAEEQADCLLFLNSQLSYCLVGCDITSDFGFTPGVFFNRCTPEGEFIDGGMK